MVKNYDAFDNWILNHTLAKEWTGKVGTAETSVREDNLLGVEEDSLHLDIASDGDVFDVEIQHQVVASHKMMKKLMIQRAGVLCEK